MSSRDVLHLIKEKEVKWADLRFTDTRGKEQHVSIPARYITDEFFVDARCSTAPPSRVEGDQRVRHDPAARCLDRCARSILEEATVNIRCDIIEPATMQGYERDPRSLGKRAEAYLKSTASPIRHCSGPRMNSSYSTACAGVPTSTARSTRSTRCRRVEFRNQLRRGQQGHRPDERRLLPRAAGGWLPGHPRRDVQGLRGNGPGGRGSSHEVATGGSAKSAWVLTHCEEGR